MKYEDIKLYIEKKLVSEQVHPENEDVRIFNYTQHCQFERIWDDVTKQCRGLIMNVKTGEIIARPFPKFFNWQEHIEKCWPVPSEVPVITEKLDGSLGILYSLNGKPWIATRGSFMSEQAQWATKWWRENFGEGETTNKITNLFEIIYPENRIVVNYEFSGLVYLGSRFTDTGQDCSASTEILFGKKIREAKKINAVSFYELEKLDEPNSEGFVAYYPIANTRIKFKFPEYVRLHKIITGVSEIGVWEMLRDGHPLDALLEKVPDEFFKWVQETEKNLRIHFAKIWGKAQLAAQMSHGFGTRKEQALYVIENYKNISGVVFSLLDGEDRKAALQVWKKIRPHGQRVFKTDIDL